MKWLSVANKTMQTSSWNDGREDGGVVEEMVAEAALRRKAVIFDGKMKYERSPAVGDAPR